MKFAVNYSPESIHLLESGRIQFDLVKLPAWPELIEKVAGEHPCYVHFPLKVGRGKGVLDNETKEPVKWNKIEKMMKKTDTPFVNLHVSLSTKHYSEIPQDSTLPEHFDRVLENILHDVCEAVKHFGPEKVIVENEHDGKGHHLQLNIQPVLFHRIIEETGCGLLLDVSHGRIAARALNLDEKQYLQALPTLHIRELHLTGIQWFGNEHIQKARNAGLDEKLVDRISYHWMDHLPMTEEDWPMIRWALDNIDSGQWRHPWVASLEYGGLGGFFGTFTEKEVLLDQIPKLYRWIRTE